MHCNNTGITSDTQPDLRQTAAVTQSVTLALNADQASTRATHDSLKRTAMHQDTCPPTFPTLRQNWINIAVTGSPEIQRCKREAVRTLSPASSGTKHTSDATGYLTGRSSIAMASWHPAHRIPDTDSCSLPFVSPSDHDTEDDFSALHPVPPVTALTSREIAYFNTGRAADKSANAGGTCDPDLSPQVLPEATSSGSIEESDEMFRHL